MKGGISSVGVEGRNYGVGDEIQVRNFRFVPQIFGGVILLMESKVTPPNGSCTQDAAAKGVADQCRHLLKPSAAARPLDRTRGMRNVSIGKA